MKSFRSARLTTHDAHWRQKTLHASLVNSLLHQSNVVLSSAELKKLCDSSFES